jgi:hypothetical protein
MDAAALVSPSGACPTQLLAGRNPRGTPGAWEAAKGAIKTRPTIGHRAAQPRDSAFDSAARPRVMAVEEDRTAPASGASDRYPKGRDRIAGSVA